jgi:hypothetical protein
MVSNTKNTVKKPGVGGALAFDELRLLREWRRCP